MKNETTLRSAKEVLSFFEAHPELTFDQMNNIVHTYAGGQFTAIVFKTSWGSVRACTDDRPKLDLLDWLKNHGEELDNGEAAHFFTSTFPKKESSND